MNILDTCNLTDDEADLCVRAINSFGDGQHPEADEASVYFFTPDYALQCLEKAKEVGHSNPLVLEALYALVIKLEAHQTQKEAEFAAFKASRKVGKQVSA